MLIGRYTFDEFYQRAAAFHGYPAPGLLIGGYMVEAARCRLPEGTLFEALVETPKCLPDAVQLLTPCTIGNGRLRIINWGLFALTLFDKYTGEGFRAFLDPARLESWPEIRGWYLKSKPKQAQSPEQLKEEIRQAGSSVCSVRPVKAADRVLRRLKMGAVVLCPRCGESYPFADGEICRKCRVGASIFG